MNVFKQDIQKVEGYTVFTLSCIRVHTLTLDLEPVNLQFKFTKH